MRLSIASRIIWLTLFFLFAGCTQKKVPDALFAVIEEKKTGYVDASGKYAIPSRFVYGERFSEGLAPVMAEGNKWGYSNAKGVLAIPAHYNQAGEFSDGLAMVAIMGEDGEDRVGFIDATGHFRIPAQFFPVFPLPKMSEGLAAVKIDPNASPVLIDAKGKIVLHPPADSIETFHAGLAAASKDGKSGYIDHSGAWAIAPQFEFAKDFSEGLAPVAIANHKWGYIDKTGKLILPAIYYWAEPFSEGLAAVADQMELWGYINRQSTLAVPFQFEQAKPFQSGLAAVGSLNGLVIIGRDGRYVAGPYRDRQPK
jgi:WG containing repeat